MFTHDWAVACGEQINANEDYRKAARSWRWPMVLTMMGAPKLGLPERSVYLDLFEGDCREARADMPADAESVPYVTAAKEMVLSAACVDTMFPQGCRQRRRKAHPRSQFRAFEHLDEIEPFILHRGTASERIRSRMYQWRAFSVRTSTFLPSRASRSRTSPAGNHAEVLGPGRTRRSTSLSARASPRAMEPKTRT
jgi:hypothetical protein